MKRTVTSAVCGAAFLLALSMEAGAAAAAAGRAAAGMHAPSASSAPAATMGPRQKMATSPSSNTTMRGPSRTGQPNQDCETLGNQPGRSMSAPGSAFNPNGTAGGVYAGEQPQNSRNAASVAQYDVACARPAK